MEVLSPRSANVPYKSRTTMKKTKVEVKPRPEEKPTNPDRIDEKWRPPVSVTEPGEAPETFITGRKLGKGGFAVCFEGRTKSSGQIFALKVVKAKVEQKKMMEKFRTELQIHAKMQHPNIVEFLRAFTLDNHTYVILELCDNGNLTDMVKARSCLSLPEVRRFMIQICGGVKYLHKRSVIHRDLKMGNIFLDSKMNLKIGDFGLAAVMADEQDRRTTLCGTPNYIAPEILSKSGTRGHDNKVDTWAVGVICYAMLMGTPPFQSKTQQEIYTKLKTLEYEWKIDSKNYIPQQAKDFVASCLNLVSSERPEMDTLVDHEFFTMGAIADVLDNSCLKYKPAWLENADPRGDRVAPGYGVSHSTICRECGVGFTVDGRPRSAVGSKANISALVEIEIENRQGSAPVIPLPEGILYKQFVEAQADWSLHQKHPIMPAKPRSRKHLVESMAIPELRKKFEDIDINPADPMPASGTVRNHLLVANKTVQSFAAQQRQQALPQRSIARNVIANQEAVQEAVITSTNGLLRAKPIRSASLRVTRSTSAQLKDALPKSTTIGSEMNRISEDKLVASSRTYKTTNLKAATISRQVLQTEHYKTLSRQMPTHAEFEKPHSSSTDSTGDDASHAAEQGTDRNRLYNRPPKSLEMTKTGILPWTQPVVPHAVYQPRIISPSEIYTKIEKTAASDVLASLQHLYIALSPHGINDAGSKRHIPNGRRKRLHSSYPRVDKWVDYATRHGIAYILTDGTLGMVLKASNDNSKPSSCVVVRNAKAHTVRRAKGLEDQFVPQGRNANDVEFYEQSNSQDDMRCLEVPARNFALDMKNHHSQVSAANALLATLVGSEAERMKEVGLLDKFGKYMNKQIGHLDIDAEFDSKGGLGEHFIHFYQRLGNVGVWRFIDGGLQFNFPDHTKLTVWQDVHNDCGLFVDLVYLEPNDAKELAIQGVLTSEALERRGVITLSVDDILTTSLRQSELEIVKSNEIQQKLSWIRAVVGCWVREGGVGRMGEEKLGWSGLQERRDDKKIKLQWVTVGRLGGDGDGALDR